MTIAMIGRMATGVGYYPHTKKNGIDRIPHAQQIIPEDAATIVLSTIEQTTMTNRREKKRRCQNLSTANTSSEKRCTSSSVVAAIRDNCDTQ